MGETRSAEPPSHSRIEMPAINSSAPTAMPLLTPIFASQPTRWRPKSTMSAPATGASSARLRSMNAPTALAEAPSAMKTAENPMTKANAVARTPARGALSSFSCSTPMPESIDTYPGTRGNTQGEMNENKPATNAVRTVTSMKPLSFSHHELNARRWYAGPRRALHSTFSDSLSQTERFFVAAYWPLPSSLITDVQYS